MPGHGSASDSNDAVVRRFVNDALWFGQLACSSPRSVVWVGEPDDVDAASRTFWPKLESASLATTPDLEVANVISKLVAEQDAAAMLGATIEPLATNIIRVVRCPISDLGRGGDSPGGGFFKEFGITHLAELAPCVRRNWQTVASEGISAERWRSLLSTVMPPGIDRIVRFGEALNFNHVWDGIDLLTGMTRIVSISSLD